MKRSSDGEKKITRSDIFKKQSDSDEDVIKFIQKKYDDADEPSSFSGPKTLLRNLQHKYPTKHITARLINIALKRLPIYLQYLPGRTNFERKRIDFTEIGISTDFQFDLVVFPEYNGLRYLFLMVDISQNYLYGEPLKTKEATESLKAFKQMCNASHLFRTMAHCTSDGGKWTPPQKAECFGICAQNGQKYNYFDEEI